MRRFYAVSILGLCCSAFTPAQAQLLTGFDDPVVSQVQPERAQPSSMSSSMEAPMEAPAVEVFEPPRELPRLAALPQSVVETTAPAYTPLLTQGAVAPASKSSDKAPVDISADQMSRDEQADTVSASGDVMIVQAGRILRADDVVYDIGADEVTARGYVVLNEENGDIHLADEAAYKNTLKDGRVENLRTTLNDGSRFTAEHGELSNGTRTVMDGASYTPCEPCKKNPDKAPLWGIRASEVEHEQEERRITYRNARFEALGVPIAYTPYFSHPDGTIQQKSGFLSPSGGFNSELGVFIENHYYWAIAPDQDLTVGALVMTEQVPLGLLEYRKRWENASLNLAGGVTYSDRTDRTGGLDVQVDDELRGHVFGEGVWNIDDKWRTGVNINYASDDQYMRTYDFTNDGVLENELYAERFSGRNYAAARLLSFQDVRIRETPLDQPDVLPEMVASFKGEPGKVPLIKGQWEVEASALGLRRDGSEQDMQRASLDLGWSRRLVSDYGLLTRVDADVRGDVYHVTDASFNGGVDNNVTETRVFPRFHMESSYPMARPFDNFQARVEPVAAVTIASDLGSQSDIPNEDSNDIQLDTKSLFNANRFPGIDRVEDRSRVTYGLRTGAYGYEGSYANVFLGQSYRFDDKNTLFPQGSGLNDRASDIVGQISASYKNVYDFDYSFQIGQENFTSERHEIDVAADWNRFRVSGSYLYANALEGTDIDESREQLDADARFYYNKEWRTRFGATQDLGVDPGLREAYLGLDYLGQCLFWSLTGKRKFTRDSSGNSDTEVLFRIGLKNLGEFQESSLRPIETVQN